jgi:DNA sulfur modification protein DndD
VRIQKVVLENFRQFLGENTINFGEGTAQASVSLVFGTNGGGKTTVLSAMYWGLHGSAPYITNPELLANSTLFAALAEDEELPVSVSIFLEEGDTTYIVKRSRLVSKQMGKEVEVRPDQLTFTDLLGNPVGNPQFEVNNRFPQKFAKFFFVPGESIDDFFKSNSLAALIENIKEISEIGSYETAISLAEKVEKKLLKEISDFSSDAAVKTARNAIESLDNQISNLNQVIHRCEQSEADDSKKISDLQRGLGETRDFDELEAKVSAIESALLSAESKQREAERDLNSTLKTKGFLAFTANLELDLADALKKLGISDSFENVISTEVLLELASREICVCGSAISEHSKAHLKSQIQVSGGTASDAPAEYKFTKLSADFSFDSFKSHIHASLERNQSLKNQILELKTSLDKELLSENKSDSRSKQYKELKAAQISLKANIALRQGTELRIKTLKENKKTAEDKLSGLLEKDSRQAQLGRDRESIARIKDHLSETLENYRSSFQLELETELNELVGSLIYEPVQVKLGQDFAFDLVRKDTLEKYAEAGGQVKAKAMAMIIALYRIAARRARKGLSLENSSLGAFPLVIDSAFGELGLELRRRVANELAKETSQCIFFISETQAPGVADSLEEKSISSRTLLHSFVTGSGPDLTEPPINGKKVVWLTFNSKTSRTEVEEL